MALPKHTPYPKIPEDRNLGDESRARRGHRKILLKSLVLIGCVVSVLRFYFPLDTQSEFGEHVQVAPDSHTFNWTSVTPSKELEWTSCYDNFECARLSVPLDYSNPKAAQAAVALVRYPSVVPRDDEGYLGPVLFNPGGPGGFGVQFMLEFSEQFRTILGKGYDLIGFDPRGLGFTTPRLETWLSKGEQGMFSTRFFPLVNSSDTALGALYATAQNIGDLAAARVGDVAQHVSTPVVARDMLSIVKAHGLDKLQYWGFSYGTVLGATFAAMFPDNVGRLIIDGVVDTENYYATLWSNNLRDANAALFAIYQACVGAGPLACPLYENSAQKIHDRVETLLDGLRSHPVTFYNSTAGTYGQVDYSATKSVIFHALYEPYLVGKKLIFALADLEKGVAEPIYTMSERKAAEGKITESCTCPAAPKDTFGPGRENTVAIACSDGDIVKDDVEVLRGYYGIMAKMSTFAECWWLRIGCSGWKVRATERFTASWETNTSFPLLMIGNTADPVTPLWNAHKMSQGFKESVVLTQDSPGHCSLSAVSLCVAKAVRAYFQNGTLPKVGTVCDVQSNIFGSESLNAISQTATSEDQDLLRASYELQQKYPVPIL